MFAVGTRQNLIPKLLERSGITVYGLAKRTGMPYHQVSRLVDSQTIPDGTQYKTLRKIAAVFGVKIDELENTGDNSHNNKQ